MTGPAHRAKRGSRPTRAYPSVPAWPTQPIPRLDIRLDSGRTLAHTTPSSLGRFELGGKQCQPSFKPWNAHALVTSTEVMELPDAIDLPPLFSEPIANRTVREEILARLRRHGGTGSISVTNLVFPRQAYHRAKFPDVELPIERRESMIAGTGFHDHFIRRVAREATMEQTLFWKNIVGRVDIYEDLPLEIKTTDTPISPGDVKRVRPSYLEQLGIYDGMAGKDRGFLLIFNRSGEPVLVGCNVDFGFLSGIRREIIRRRDAFQAALASDDPTGLPACPFAGSTCVFFEKGICTCDPALPKDFPIADLAKVTPNEALAEEFTRRYREGLKRSPSDFITVNDLVRPREAYFRGLSTPEEGEEDVAEHLRAADNYAFYREFKRQCFYGSDLHAERKEYKGVRGRVEFQGGRVVVFTRCSFNEPVKRYLLARSLPEPFLRLGFNCVLANRGRARLVVWYPKIPAENERVLVYDLTVQDLQRLRREMDDRISALRDARSSGDFSGLPKCQAWRAKVCGFSPQCGCG